MTVQPAALLRKAAYGLNHNPNLVVCCIALLLLVLLPHRRAVSDASMAAVARAAGLHLAGGDKDFSPTSASLDFPDNCGADLVMQVSVWLWGRGGGDRPGSLAAQHQHLHACMPGVGVSC